MNQLKSYLRGPAFIIPFIGYLFALCFAWYIAFSGNCNPFEFNCWFRWDSALYIDVAQNGHTLYFGNVEQTNLWQGNAGWAPLYPLLMRFLYAILHLPYSTCGVILSELFFFLFLLVSARLIEIKSFTIRNWLLIGICAFTPGNIYFHAVFPISLTAFLLVSLLYYLTKENFLAAGIFAFLAVLSYSGGVFLIATLGLFALTVYLRKTQFWSLGFGTILPACFGLIALFVYDYFATGHWNAMFLLQTKYGHSINSPLKMLGIHLHRLFTTQYSLNSWEEIQNLILMILVIIALIFLFKKRKKAPFYAYTGIFILFFWFGPYSIGPKVSLYRSAALLSSSHSAFNEIPVWALSILLALFLILSYPLGKLFILNILV